MAPSTTLITRLRAQLRMAINRLRLVQQKETAAAKQQRRFMAQLLEEGREQSARIRVEHIIRQDLHVEVLEVLELYCELLLARIALLETSAECDPGLEEAVKTLIWAAPRTEVKELHNIREILMRKFSKEFVQDAMENTSKVVSEKVVKRLAVEPPKPQLVDLYLVEIAKAYGAPYSGMPEDEGDEVISEKSKEGRSRDLSPIEKKSRRLSGLDNLPDPEDDEKPPIKVNTPSPSTDNPRPQLKTALSEPKNEMDDLRARFEALKKK